MYKNFLAIFVVALTATSTLAIDPSPEQVGGFVRGLIAEMFEQDLGNVEHCVQDDQEIVLSMIRGFEILQSNDFDKIERGL